MMKNYFDQFYEVLHKNSIKRRRMISLLLVLSMFVSSSVVWGLRGTVVTMVNEPDEVLEEMPDADETEAEKLAYHVHTDDCYEDVLICELEENEEHTHTEECYEKQLICGFEDEKEADASAEAEVTGEDAELIYEPEDESEDEEYVLILLQAKKSKWHLKLKLIPMKVRKQLKQEHLQFRQASGMKVMRSTDCFPAMVIITIHIE